MSQNKLFDVAGLAGNKLPKALLPLTNLCSYFFSVVWTRDGSAISLSSVVISENGGPWKQLLTTVITESDGEMHVPMGLFNRGTTIDLIFNVFPHQNIAAAAINIVNHTANTFQRIAPATGTQALTKGKPWSAILTITLQ